MLLWKTKKVLQLLRIFQKMRSFRWGYKSKKIWIQKCSGFYKRFTKSFQNRITLKYVVQKLKANQYSLRDLSGHWKIRSTNKIPISKGVYSEFLFIFPTGFTSFNAFPLFPQLIFFAFVHSFWCYFPSANICLQRLLTSIIRTE